MPNPKTDDSLTFAFLNTWALASVVDDVFTEEDAFNPGKIYAGLGRIHREWKNWRTALDPEFRPERWQHRRTQTEPKMAKWNYRSVTETPEHGTAITPTNEMSRLRNALLASISASPFATNARTE